MARSGPAVPRSEATMPRSGVVRDSGVEEEDRAPSVEEVGAVRSKELTWQL